MLHRRLRCSHHPNGLNLACLGGRRLATRRFSYSARTSDFYRALASCFAAGVADGSLLVRTSIVICCLSPMMCCRLNQLLRGWYQRLGYDLFGHHSSRVTSRFTPRLAGLAGITSSKPASLVRQDLSVFIKEDLRRCQRNAILWNYNRAWKRV